MNFGNTDWNLLATLSIDAFVRKNSQTQLSDQLMLFCKGSKNERDNG